MQNMLKYTMVVAFGLRVVRKIREAPRNLRGNRLILYSLKKADEVSLKLARQHLKCAGVKHNFRIPRVIPIIILAGVLLLPPISPRIPTLGNLLSAVAGPTRTVQSAKVSRNPLEVAHRQNKTSKISLLYKVVMEFI